MNQAFECESCGGLSIRTVDRRDGRLCHDCKREAQADYLPTPEQIKEQTAAIRETWSASEELTRRVGTHRRIPFEWPISSLMTQIK